MAAGVIAAVALTVRFAVSIVVVLAVLPVTGNVVVIAARVPVNVAVSGLLTRVLCVVTVVAVIGATATDKALLVVTTPVTCTSVPRGMRPTRQASRAGAMRTLVFCRVTA